MAFVVQNLSVLAYAGGFTLWHYKAESDVDAVKSHNFFTKADEMLTTGDMVMVSGSAGGGMLCVVSESGRIATTPLC